MSRRNVRIAVWLTVLLAGMAAWSAPAGRSPPRSGRDAVRAAGVEVTASEDEMMRLLVPETITGQTLFQLAAAHGLQGLSMGMTDDYPVAVEEGATVVRVGPAIFGAR